MHEGNKVGIMITLKKPTPESPPPVGRSELLVLWERLPPANRQRLLWLLSQLLEHQLHTAVARGEDGDESASRP